MREAAAAPKTERRCERPGGDFERDLPVTEEFMPLDAARASFDTSRLPEGIDGPVRIVAIGDYDRCPCIGPHVSSTGAIGAFRITSTGQQDGVLRIRFKLHR